MSARSLAAHDMPRMRRVNKRALRIAPTQVLLSLIYMHVASQRFSAQAGTQVLGVKLPFDEAALLRENLGHIREKVNVLSVSIHEASQAAAEAKQMPRIMEARPGLPVALFNF